MKNNVISISDRIYILIGAIFLTFISAAILEVIFLPYILEIIFPIAIFLSSYMIGINLVKKEKGI